MRKDAKTFLKAVRIYDIMVHDLLQELQDLRDMTTKITASMSSEPGSGSGSKDKLGAAVARIVDLENEINEVVQIYSARKEEVLKILEQVQDPDQFHVLHSRYILFKTFEKIACEMHMTYRNVCYIHGRALQNVEFLLKGINPYDD